MNHRGITKQITILVKLRAVRGTSTSPARFSNRRFRLIARSFLFGKIRKWGPQVKLVPKVSISKHVEVRIAMATTDSGLGR